MNEQPMPRTRRNRSHMPKGSIIPTEQTKWNTAEEQDTLRAWSAGRGWFWIRTTLPEDLDDVPTVLLLETDKFDVWYAQYEGHGGGWFVTFDFFSESLLWLIWIPDYQSLAEFSSLLRSPDPQDRKRISALLCDGLGPLLFP